MLAVIHKINYTVFNLKTLKSYHLIPTICISLFQTVKLLSGCRKMTSDRLQPLLDVCKWVNSVNHQVFFSYSTFKAITSNYIHQIIFIQALTMIPALLLICASIIFIFILSFKSYTTSRFINQISSVVTLLSVDFLSHLFISVSFLADRNIQSDETGDGWDARVWKKDRKEEKSLHLREGSREV